MLHFQSEWRIFPVGGGAFLGCMHLRAVLDLAMGDFWDLRLATGMASQVSWYHSVHAVLDIWKFDHSV